MTHDPMALILAVPVLLVAIYFCWTGFRITWRTPAEADTDETP